MITEFVDVSLEDQLDEEACVNSDDEHESEVISHNYIRKTPLIDLLTHCL